MDTVRICKQCRQTLPENATDGLCPQCQAAGPIDEVAPALRIPPEAAELAPFFPQLEIIELLGMGGMGMVYKARQPQLDRLVALKILPMDSAPHPSFAERFNREAKALAKLNSPGIVAIYDFGQTGQYYYFVMEYVDGMNLRELLASQTVTVRQTLEFVVQICAALQYAHDEGVVHRDIKPANILVTKKGQVKIADFGLAKLLGTAAEAALTTSQASMGTLNYMAPEQRENAQGVDQRADIYSLGVVFYEMLTGEIPMGRFDPPSKKATMDARLDEVVLRALDREPARRYQTASEVRSGVEAITHFPSGQAEPPTPRLLPKWRGWFAGCSLIAAALAAVLFSLKMRFPNFMDMIVKPGPGQWVARGAEQLERYDRPGHLETAIHDLREAIREDASFTDAHAFLGLAYWRLYKRSAHEEYLSDADRYSSNALACNQFSYRGWFVQGLVAQEEKRRDRAADCLNRANKLAKWEDGEVLIQLATVYRNLKDGSNSLYCIDKANQVQSKPWYFFNAMGSYELERDVQLAITNFQSAIHKAADSPIAWLNLGVGLLYQGDGDETDHALKCIQKSLTLDPTEAAYNDLGEYFMMTTNWPAAATNFHAAALMNPDRYDFAGNEGLALIRLPDHQSKAREQLSKALDKSQSLLEDTRNTLAVANRGLYQAALGLGDQAYATLRQAAELYPGDQRVRDNIEAAAVLLQELYHSHEADHLRQLLSEKTVNK